MSFVWLIFHSDKSLQYEDHLQPVKESHGHEVSRQLCPYLMQESMGTNWSSITSLDLEWLNYSCRSSHPHFVKILGFEKNDVSFVFLKKRDWMTLLITVQSTKIALLCINNWLLKVDYNGGDDRCSRWENLHGQCLIKELEILQSLWKCVNSRLYLLLSPNPDKGMD